MHNLDPENIYCHYYNQEQNTRLRSYFILCYYIMSRQSSRKEHPTDNKVEKSSNAEPIDLQNLLLVGGITINHKQVGSYNNDSKKMVKNVRKASHKSLGVNVQMAKQKQRFKVPSSRHPTEVVNTKNKKLTKQTKQNEDLNHEQKQNLVNTPNKQKAKQAKPSRRKQKQQKEQNQQKQQKQPAKTVQVQNNFVEKKMKIGHRAKSDAMKQFIIQTLLKGKAEGNSLTIHKGTAHVNSPRREYNKSEVNSNSKDKYSLVLVQQKSRSVVSKRKPFLPPLPNQPRVQKAQSRNVSNVPSLPQNKKWVAMVKKMQKKQTETQQPKPEQKQPQQLIEQNIIEENVSDMHMPIPQEIHQ